MYRYYHAGVDGFEKFVLFFWVGVIEVFLEIREGNFVSVLVLTVVLGFFLYCVIG